VFHADVWVLEKVRLPVRHREQFVRELTSLEQSTDASRRASAHGPMIVDDEGQGMIEGVSTRPDLTPAAGVSAPCPRQECHTRAIRSPSPLPSPCPAEPVIRSGLRCGAPRGLGGDQPLRRGGVTQQWIGARPVERLPANPDMFLSSRAAARLPTWVTRARPSDRCSLLFWPAGLARGGATLMTWHVAFCGGSITRGIACVAATRIAGAVEPLSVDQSNGGSLPR